LDLGAKRRKIHFFKRLVTSHLIKVRIDFFKIPGISM
jgi:hypothetical protein